MNPEIARSLVGRQLPEYTHTYTERDVALYALGIGFPTDPLDHDQLRFVYERSAAGFEVFPTFATLFTAPLLGWLATGQLGELQFDPMMVVHGDQSIALHLPLQTQGTITCRAAIESAYDKGSGMLLTIATEAYNAQGAHMVTLRKGLFIRGLGGFGGDRGPSFHPAEIDRARAVLVRYQTLSAQALLYRLSGDLNPLHADPVLAGYAGFERPILHGLATFGYGLRAVLATYCENDVGRMHTYSARFSHHVYPGETLEVAMVSQPDGSIALTIDAVERQQRVLANGLVTLREPGREGAS
jgi:acyl dehydratase